MNSSKIELIKTTAAKTAPELSLFLPVLNEEENLRPMHTKISEALNLLGKTAEVIYVDDGSTDKSLQVLREIAGGDERVRVISLRRNYGQTAAMSAGIDAAKGEILIPMDADLQNDPADIARLLDKLNEGYDVVSGWRKNRKDKLIMRKIPSWIANSVISKIGGVPLHDYGCSLKSLSPRSHSRCQTIRRNAPFYPDLRELGRARELPKFLLTITPERWANRNTEFRGQSKSFLI